MQAAKRLGCCAFIETAAKTNEGCNECLDLVIKAAFSYCSSVTPTEATVPNPLRIEDFEPRCLSASTLHQHQPASQGRRPQTAPAPAPAPAPPVPPHLQSDIDRVTSMFELVQLAKAAGVATTAINMCFDDEVLWRLDWSRSSH